MICENWKVVVVPFPFVDAPITKTRPTLVLSSVQFNSATDQTICAMITTAARSRWSNDLAISDLESAGLRTPCVVRWKVFTLENALIARSVGSLGPSDRQHARAAVEEIFLE